MKTSIFSIALSTVLQVFWIGLIGRHYGVAIIASTLIIFIALSFYLLSLNIRTFPWYGRAFVGTITGFLGGIVATFAAELSLKGTSFLLSEYPISNLYFFPTFLFGWVYGAIFFTAGAGILECKLWRLGNRVP